MVDEEEETLLKLSRYPLKGNSNEIKRPESLKGIHIPGMTLKTQLAIGQQGSVYQAIIDGNEVAIKIDKIPRGYNPNSYFQNEIHILKLLSGIEGVPSLISSSESDSYLYFTMPLLGKDLQTYTLNHQVYFPVECALCLGIELIFILQQIHSKGVLHQDIKPANITIGSPRSQRSVNIIDFGSAQQFEVDQNGKMKSTLFDCCNKNQFNFTNCSNDETVENVDIHLFVFLETNKMQFHGCLAQFVGNYLFASIDAHEGNEQGRKGDLFSICYLLIFISGGQLTWEKENDRTKVHTKKKEYLKFIDKKGLTSSFQWLLKYLDGLNFDSCPDYKLIVSEFRKNLKHLGIQDSTQFNWVKVMNKRIQDQSKKQQRSPSTDDYDAYDERKKPNYTEMMAYDEMQQQLTFLL